MKTMIYILFFGLFCLMGLLVLACLFRAFGFLLSSFNFFMSKLPKKEKAEKAVEISVDEKSDLPCEMESVKVGDENDITSVS